MDRKLKLIDGVRAYFETDDVNFSPVLENIAVGYVI